VLLFLSVALAGAGARLRQAGWLAQLARAAAICSAVFFAGVLVLTQSRGAWLGALFGCAAMAWLRWPKVRWPAVALGGAVALAVWAVGPHALLVALFPAPGSQGQLLSTVTLEGRVELWKRAVVAIGDFAFTGCGFGAFRRVVWALYPPFLVSPGHDYAHAHNVFLQVALDVGLPGLIAYLALIGVALWVALRAARQADASQRWLGLGAAGSLVSFHVFGLTDTIALGARPGIAFWLLLALIVVAGQVSRTGGRPECRTESGWQAR